MQALNFLLLCRERTIDTPAQVLLSVQCDKKHKVLFHQMKRDQNQGHIRLQIMRVSAEDNLNVPNRIAHVVPVECNMYFSEVLM